jgi:hypothetical protein
MAQRTQPPYLTGSEYISSDQSENSEIAGARWEFMEVVRRVLPRFFEQLRARVYPTYARLAENRCGYWEPGWRFETWQLHSDRDNQLTPCLLAWARAFNAEEAWIFEGALQTLWLWHQYPEWRESLDISGFRSFRGVEVLTSEEERSFQFEDPGWDPQFQRWARYRAYIQKQFEKKLDAYEERLRSLAESRGAVRARYRYSVDNFEWFALYQLANMRAARILQQRTDLKGDESTIQKGVKAAAALLRWQNIQPARKRNVALSENL